MAPTAPNGRVVQPILLLIAMSSAWELDLDASSLARIAPPHQHHAVRKVARSARSDHTGESPLIRVAALGGDPTGRRDSSKAFGAAVAEAISRASGRLMGDNVKDLGGAVIDLEGGDYIVSTPIVVPPM